MALEIICQELLEEKYREGVWKLLKDADQEFIPPLSSREKTTQKSLAPKDGDAGDSRGPVKYFEQMLKQAFILAIKDGEVKGFMTYIPDHELFLKDQTIPCNYISTIIVEPKSRRQGITRRMYGTLFQISQGKSIATRTWSTNKEHLVLLHELEFQLAACLTDDRGPGIDTVYYVKENGQA
ncbi:MAG: GNAT family N-acetyltransferase [Treponema sp.]|nr:GNAT family N-acetyltransferase [Treponema sp.]